MSDAFQKVQNKVVQQVQPVKPNRPTIFNMIYEEKKEIDDKWKQPTIPYFKYVMELRKTSWAGMMIGSYKFVLQNRKKKMVERIKQRFEEDKKQGKIKNTWFKSFKQVGMYVFLASFLCSMFAPPLMINFVKNKIQSGDWVDANVSDSPQEGPEFMAESMANETVQEPVFQQDQGEKSDL